MFPHDCRDFNGLTNSNIAVADNPTFGSSPRNATSDSESDQQPEEPRMIGDFDGSATEFWKIFKDEANSHDDARINTLKEGMESSLIFVRFLSVHPLWLC